ncbi:hypothetical protein LK09_13055 [Microbacterium mangrovi]|uniref:FHA domain-containing protein n=1 Tax=Microbacterium mangrovi TaxID=1348253 RepID=A0A0B2A6L0_9MICO|nr:RDD family protein [Microbacterium mangrovi]KHK97183.1 hypothetical protein LK09_13055 [Microbacterium mangrovi]
MASFPPDSSEPEALATLGSRIGACVIDAVPFAIIGALSGIITIIIGVSGVSSHEIGQAGSGAGVVQVIAAVLMFAWWLTITIMQGGQGSVGQRICGIHAVDARDARPLGFLRSALRNIVWLASCLILVGFVTPLFDEKLHQGWHDKAAGSLVVERVRVSGVAGAVRAVASPDFVAASSVVPAATAPIPSLRPTPSVPPVPPPPAPAVSLIWDDGTRIPVHARTVFGRNPQAQDGAAVIPVQDDSLSLSKTHFQIEIATDSAYITDLNSTNGTVLVRSGTHERLTPGVRVPLRPGDQLEFGDRFAVVGRS